MPYVDSVDKIVSSYFAAVTRQRFTYKDVEYLPRPLRVSEGLFRGYTCPPNCGACCTKFTLDFLPLEPQPEGLIARMVRFNGEVFVLMSDHQEENETRWCHNLNHDDGRCKIHGRHPFSCDFELIRASISTDNVAGQNQLSTRLYGRAWNMLQVGGERGAQCEILPPSTDSTRDAHRKLVRLKQWTDYFGLETVLPQIIEWVDSGPHSQPLFLNQDQRPKQKRMSLF